jgi:hypothetical protein
MVNGAGKISERAADFCALAWLIPAAAQRVSGWPAAAQGVQTATGVAKRSEENAN